MFQFLNLILTEKPHSTSALNHSSQSPPLPLMLQTPELPDGFTAHSSRTVDEFPARISLLKQDRRSCFNRVSRWSMIWLLLLCSAQFLELLGQLKLTSSAREMVLTAGWLRQIGSYLLTHLKKTIKLFCWLVETLSKSFQNKVVN